VAEFVEPAEERPAGGPGEGPLQHRFFHAWRLTDEHDLAEHWPTGNRRRQHARTAPALEQARHMLIQQLLPARSSTHYHDDPSRMPQDSECDNLGESR
jgi:hypothetical protein